jgi:hypothetical protein
VTLEHDKLGRRRQVPVADDYLHGNARLDRHVLLEDAVLIRAEADICPRSTTGKRNIRS